MALLHLLVCYCFITTLSSCHEVYHGGIVSDGLQTENSKAEADDPHCNHHIHKFYRQMRCQPETSPDYKCPVSYKCETLQGRRADICYFSGYHYPIGANITRDMVDFHTPCIESCQCVRMYEGARFYCSKVTQQVCQTPLGCKHFDYLEDFPCCQRGVISCNQGKQDSVKCVYEGRSYREGERFFASDDITCTQCVCASGFNGTIEPPYCHQLSCVLELWGDTPVMLTRGCIPVYLSDSGCCPITYRCPRPSDRVVKIEKDSSISTKTNKKCHFGNLTMDVGDQLSPWTETNAKDVECTCRVPPMASCVRRNFVLTEEIRNEFAREGLDNQP